MGRGNSKASGGTYNIKRRISGSKKSRQSSYSYTINDSTGNVLTFDGAAVTFNTEQQAKDFIKKRMKDIQNNDRYRWFKRR